MNDAMKTPAPNSAAPYCNAKFVHGTSHGGRLPADVAGKSLSRAVQFGKIQLHQYHYRTAALARTSKTPGRTQQINFFDLDGGERRLVDLPGYGYAKVSEEMRRRWRPLIEVICAIARRWRG